MVKLRLQRFGRKKLPCYRVVVQDSRAKRDGKYIDLLGFYHPLAKEDKQFRLKKKKVPTATLR